MGKLVALTLSNFKSYRNDVVINLGDADFISIIGPNGSGKSNIMDAISFVLGVDSHYLRSSSLSQLIYRGKKDQNDHVKPSKAFVEAKYQKDNGDVIVFYRDIDTNGSTCYKVNGNITDFEEYIDYLKQENILVQVRNFLVFQGDVEQVASKNPSDLTAFFEEISGSIQFKKEYDDLKQEYLGTAAECEAAILEKRRLQTELHHYKESVLKDTKYSTKVAEKEHLWKQYYLWQLLEVDSKLETLKDSKEAVDSDHEEIEKNLAEKEEALQEFKSNHVEMELKLSTKENEIKKLENQINKIKTKDLVKISKTKKTYSTLISESKDREEILNQDLTQQEERLEKLSKQLSVLEEEKLQIEESLTKILSEHSKHQALTIQDLNDINNARAVYLNDLGGTELDKNIQLQLNNIDEKKSQLRKVNNQISSVTLLVSDLNTKLQEKINEINLHEENIDSLKLDSKDQKSQKKKCANKIQTLTKKINLDNIKLRNTLVRLDELAADQRETKQEQKMKDIIHKLGKFFPGVKGFVIDLFTPKSKKYNQAVSLLIGRNIYSIVVDTALTATQCISFMKEQRLGIATFLPLDTINGVSQAFQLYAKDAVFASSVIDCSSEYNKVLKYLCGDTIISDSLEVAQRLKWEENYNCRIISVNGSVIQKSGIMTGGVSGNSGTEVRWNKIEFKELSTLKDDLLAEIQNSQEQIKLLNDKSKAAESIVRSNENEMVKLKDLIASIENSKQDLLKQITYNTKTIDDQYNKERDELQLKINEINKTYERLTSQKDEIQQNLFKSLSDKFGFSVLEYEKTTGYFLREKKKQLDFVTRAILQQQSKITFEAQKKINIEGSITDLNKIINDSETTLKALEKEEDESVKLVAEKAEAVENKQQELLTVKSSFKEEISTIDQLQVDVNELKQSYDNLSSKQFSIKIDIDSLLEQRFSILKTCRMNAIDVPMENNIEFADIKLEFMHDVDDFAIDFNQLDKKLLTNKKKKLSEKEIDAQFQEKISSTEEELLLLQPNTHAQERFDEIQNKFNDYNENVVNNLKQREKKLLLEFNKVKNDRKAAFMETFDYVVKHIDAVYKELTTDSSSSSSLLSGGSAALTLDYNEDADSDEPYLSGLKYQATPPLKKFKEIEYLSGGEKTVAALALLFTINMFKPSPFFILDEIDAALDSVNVLRVSNYIRTHANTNLQFIVISLKNTIFEESDSLVGVYRDQSMNSSRVLTLDLSQYD